MPNFVASKAKVPLGALITAEALKSKVKVTVSWGQETSFTADGTVVASTSSGVAR